MLNAVTLAWSGYVLWSVARGAVMSDDVGSPEVAVALALLAVDDPATADDAQAALDCLTAGTDDLGLVTQQAVQDWVKLF